MKLKYLFSTILASALMLVGCVQESVDSFDNIKLSQTYLSIPEEGGTATTTVTATGDWAFVPSSMVEWLTIDNTSGLNGETVVTFSAEGTDSGREAELEIKAGNNSQFIRVRQGSLLAEMATCAEIIAGPDGKNYKAKGICTSIASDYYGNWYLNDGTGEVYVYGTVNSDGEYDWASFGIEVGDSVYVEGPKKTYNGTIELVNVTVSKVVKALLSLPKEGAKLEKTAQDHVFEVAYKGKGVFVEVSDEAKDWITYKSMSFKKGVPSKLEPNPADTAVVTVSIAAVPETIQKPRQGEVIVKSYLSEKESSVGVYTVKQMGHTPELTKINALSQQNADEKTYVRVEGNVVALYQRGLLVADETGAVLVYYGKDYDTSTYKIGNKILVQGEVGLNNFGIQIAPDYDELLDADAKFEYGTPVAYDADKLNGMLKTLIDGGHGKDKNAYYGVNTEYATFTGKLVVSGTYYNVKIEGAEKDASLSYPLESLKLENYNDKNVVLTGYVFSVSCSKDVPTYVNMIVTSVELDNVIYKESFAAGIGEYTIDNKSLGTLTKEVWNHDSKYKYMKGSGYGGGDGVESWLVSPVYDLAGQTAVFLSFDHILNYLKGAPREDHVNVLVKEEGATDWTVLSGFTWPEGTSWDPVNSGKVDLSEYAGKKIQIAFKYTTAGGKATTWEVYNVKLTFN